MSTDGQGTKWRRNIAGNFNRLSRVRARTLQTDDRQTDRRTGDIAYRERERELNVSSRSLITLVDKPN